MPFVERQQLTASVGKFSATVEIIAGLGGGLVKFRPTLHYEKLLTEGISANFGWEKSSSIAYVKLHSSGRLL